TGPVRRGSSARRARSGAGDVGVLPDRLPMSARGRGPVRRHPPGPAHRSTGAGGPIGDPARSPPLAQPSAWRRDAARLPPLGRAGLVAAAGVRRRAWLESAAALRAVVRAARAARLRARGALRPAGGAGSPRAIPAASRLAAPLRRAG